MIRWIVFLMNPPDARVRAMHFNWNSTVMIIISTLHQTHLYRNFYSANNRCRPDHPLSAFQMLWSPRCLRNLHLLPSVPLPSNLINVPAHRRKRRGCGSSLKERRFSLLTHGPSPRLFFQLSRLSSPECSICTYFELNVAY